MPAAVFPMSELLALGISHKTAPLELREGVAFTGLRTRASRKGHRVVTGLETTDGTIATDTVILTGGPAMQSVASLAGARAWVGYARHMVVVTEPSPVLHPDTTAMAFDIGAGIYWRPEDFRMDRFDEHGNPPYVDPVALPFPVKVDD